MANELLASEANCSRVWLDSLILHFHISHSTPYSPPKILHNLCFSFLLGITVVPREIENNAYAKFWGANKVHFGGCATTTIYICTHSRSKTNYNNENIKSKN